MTWSLLSPVWSPATGNSFEAWDDIQEVQTKTSSLERLAQQEECIHILFLLHEVLENRNRPNNNRVCGLPKATGSEDLF